MQGSWTQKLIDRIYNIEKKRKRTDSDSPRPVKRGRPNKSSKQSSRYPVLKESAPAEDVDTRNHQALAVECEREKPRKDLVVQLMKDTCKFHFSVRKE